MNFNKINKKRKFRTKKNQTNINTTPQRVDVYNIHCHFGWIWINIWIIGCGKWFERRMKKKYIF